MDDKLNTRKFTLQLRIVDTPIFMSSSNMSSPQIQCKELDYITESDHTFRVKIKTVLLQDRASLFEKSV